MTAVVQQPIGSSDACDLQVNWHITIMPGKRRVLNLETASGQPRNVAERVKAGTRAKVGHPS
jgi:hypothetical protein